MFIFIITNSDVKWKCTREVNVRARARADCQEQQTRSQLKPKRHSLNLELFTVLSKSFYDCFMFDRLRYANENCSLVICESGGKLQF